MARTSGHGNAIWTRDETILALELLLDCKGALPSDTDPRVVALSDYLRALPIHPSEKKKASFRNPDGVAFKLQNLKAVATGKGLKNVSLIDRMVWKEFGDKPAVVRQLAKGIRANTVALSALPTIDTPEAIFWEGRTATVLHVKRERNPTLRARVLAARRKSGKLCCDVCNATAPRIEGLEHGIFEVHHLRPLSETGPTKTGLSDLALVCANCHRLWHRAMADRKSWLGLADFRKLIGTDKLLQKSAKGELP